MIDELLDLLRLHRDQPLIAALLPILLLEHDAWHSTDLPLLSRDARPRFRPWDGEDRLIVLRIGAGEALEVVVGRGEVGQGIVVGGGYGGGGGGGEGSEAVEDWV